MHISPTTPRSSVADPHISSTDPRLRLDRRLVQEILLPYLTTRDRATCSLLNKKWQAWMPKRRGTPKTISDLPHDVLHNCVLSCLYLTDLMRTAEVNREWYQATAVLLSSPTLDLTTIFPGLRVFDATTWHQHFGDLSSHKLELTTPPCNRQAVIRALKRFVWLKQGIPLPHTDEDPNVPPSPSTIPPPPPLHSRLLLSYQGTISLIVIPKGLTYDKVVQLTRHARQSVQNHNIATVWPPWFSVRQILNQRAAPQTYAMLITDDALHNSRWVSSSHNVPRGLHLSIPRAMEIMALVLLHFVTFQGASLSLRVRSEEGTGVVSVLAIRGRNDVLSIHDLSACYCARECGVMLCHRL